MRIVATSDTHYPVTSRDLIPDGDVYLHCGDLMNTGYPDDWKLQLEWLSQVKHPHKFLVPGNHDFHMEVYPGPALQDLRRLGFTVLGFPGNINFYTAELPNKMILGGMAYVSDLQNRWAFGENTFRRFSPGVSPLEMVSSLIRKCDIIMTHSPILGILDKSLRNNAQAGERVFKDALVSAQLNGTQRVRHWFHGHIHEGRGKVESPTLNVYNVSMCNRSGQQVNKPMVIDL